MPASPSAAALSPLRLRCEATVNPLGLDTPHPRLSWQLAADRRAERQTGYQVLVASSRAALATDRGDLWDSGRVASGETLNVVYAGRVLRSGQRAWWKVRVWDRGGRPSGWSAPAWWEMGLLRPEDWRARWIEAPAPMPEREEEFYADRPAPLFRHEFTLRKPVRRARAYISGLGYYELRINGERVGDRLLDPAWTAYAKRVFYAAYDVTGRLSEGRMAVGVMLGNGWYNPLPLRMWGHLNPRQHLTVGAPRLILQLEIEFTDGSRQTVVSDESWKTADGPILRNSLYLGEVYDARRERPGWDRPDYLEEGWRPARRAAAPVGPLQAQTLPPIKATLRIKPVAVTEPKPGVFLFDLGRNFAGWVTLRAQGEAGTRITLRYGELRYPDGMLNPMTSVAGQVKRRGVGGPGAPDVAVQSDTWILRGGFPERYTPRFTWHGFRYVEVTGYPGRPPLDALEGLRLHTDVESAGMFECSNGLLNRIQQMARRTLLSNMFSVQSDCPHRERFGYGGDIVATSEAAIFNLDMARFYAKAVQDLADAARPNGGMTETAPFVGIADAGLGEGSGPVGWGTAFPLLQWQLYQYYGDRRLLAEHYPAAKRWLALLESRAQDGILDNGISDHESLVPKPVALTGTAFYYLNARLLERIARVLGHNGDARRYGRLAAGVADAFNRRFLKPGTGVYDTGTQACQAFALHFGLAPEGERAAVLDALARDILEGHGGHLTTGIFGTKYMLDALTQAGRADVAFTVVAQKTFPGWGWMLENGATTLWETWAFSDNIFSHNHPMFGSVSEWFFKALAGIRPASEAVGFDRILLRPEIVGGLTWAKGSYRSARGPVAVVWRRTGDRLALTVTVPVGATAEVYVPTTDRAGITEGGRPAGRAEGVKFAGMAAGRAVYQVESGTYRFLSPLTGETGRNGRVRP